MSETTTEELDARAAVDRAILRTLMAVREECARVCDRYASDDPYGSHGWPHDAAVECARRIRLLNLPSAVSE